MVKRDATSQIAAAAQRKVPETPDEVGVFPEEYDSGNRIRDGLGTNTAQKSQAERFKEAARRLGTNESDDALDRAMDKLDLKAKPKLEGDTQKPPKSQEG